jgi:hypothetical protein
MQPRADHDQDPSNGDAELEIRLLRERPLPRPEFRGALRREIEGKPRTRGAASAAGWRVLAGTYLGLGSVLLLVALAGVTGLGPFAA